MALQIHRSPANTQPSQLVKHRRHLIAPIIHLTGHQASVQSCQFSQSGQLLATGSFDRSILIWSIGGGRVENTLGVQSLHKNAITDLKWSPLGDHLLHSASADCTVASFDLQAGGGVVRRYRGHEGVVNSIATSASGLLASVGDDAWVGVWDGRAEVMALSVRHAYPLLAVEVDANQVYAAGVDNLIHVWDIRALAAGPLYSLAGHGDTVTGLHLSPDGGSRLVSTAMDNACRVWDVKPCPVDPSRQLQVLHGAPHGHGKNVIKPSWNCDGSQVACGSGDHTVVVWDLPRRAVLFKLPGHTGTVNQVHFHPSQPILASCSDDSTVFVGDLEAKSGDVYS